MTHKSHLTRCATLAIAATLALGSTPLLAQDVAAPPAAAAPPPVIVIPEPAPAPTIVIPEELSQPPAAAAPQQPARTTPRATAPTQTRATAPRPAAAAPAPATPVDTAADATVAETAPVAQAPIAVPPAPEPELAPTTEQARGFDSTMAIALGILVALALIALAFLGLRRRKGSKRYATEPRTAQPAVAAREPVELPEVPATPGSQPALAQARPAVSYSSAAFGAAVRPSGSGLSHSGASVALPREAPKGIEEREELIQRMVNAQPDRANPFRSVRARAKRARLILASLGHDFKDRDPWIDLSQYPSNWPELARRQSAAA